MGQGDVYLVPQQRYTDMEKQMSSTRKRLKQQAKEPWLCPECGGSLVYNFEKQGLFCERCREVREIQTLDRPGDPLPGEPEYLVPFSADFRDCKSSIERYVKDAMFVPRSFLSDENLEKAQPYYVPYWSYTVTQSGKPQMQGVKVSSFFGLFTRKLAVTSLSNACGSALWRTAQSRTGLKT